MNTTITEDQAHGRDLANLHSITCSCGRCVSYGTAWAA